MDFLEAIPHEDGLEILKEKLYEKLEGGKFELLDGVGKSYFSGVVHRVFFDNAGVLTFTFEIPKEDHFTVWNKSIRILSNDDKIITEVLTPEIQFVKGVGGEQVLKLAVAGEAGEVIFKADEYMTESEVEEFFMVSVMSSIALSTTVATSLLEAEIKQI